MSNQVDQLRSRLKDAVAGEDDGNLAPLIVRETETFKLTAGELKAACEQCKDHPNAAVFKKAVGKFPDGKEVTIERIDLEAMLDGLETVIDQTVEDAEDGKVRVNRKRNVKPEGTPKPVAPAAGKTQDPKAAGK